MAGDYSFTSTMMGIGLFVRKLGLKFTSQDFPMKMYYDDFDANGSFETIVATEKEGSIINIRYG
jgi:hypothetical protein